MNFRARDFGGARASGVLHGYLGALLWEYQGLDRNPRVSPGAFDGVETGISGRLNGFLGAVPYSLFLYCR